MLAGLGLLFVGIGTMMYGLWFASQGVASTGRVTPGSRRIQFCGMSLAVGGAGIMMLAITQVAVNVIGGILVVQSIAMLMYSPRIEKHFH